MPRQYELTAGAELAGIEMRGRSASMKSTLGQSCCSSVKSFQTDVHWALRVALHLTISHFFTSLFRVASTFWVMASVALDGRSSFTA